tara:strand:- start:2790 stop:2999 length:210 start_codon:yes stop_codon:yes gene_type:complete
MATGGDSRRGTRWKNTARRLELLGFLKRRTVVDGVIVYTKMAPFPASATLPFMPRNLEEAARKALQLRV